jgi:hypothetical protein
MAHAMFNFGGGSTGNRLSSSGKYNPLCNNNGLF